MEGVLFYLKSAIYMYKISNDSSKRLFSGSPSLTRMS
jgi:hypothetical protein